MMDFSRNLPTRCHKPLSGHFLIWSQIIILTTDQIMKICLLLKFQTSNACILEIVTLKYTNPANGILDFC